MKAPTPKTIASKLKFQNNKVNGFGSLTEAFINQLGDAKNEMSDLQIELLYRDVKKEMHSKSINNEGHWALVG